MQNEDSKETVLGIDIGGTKIAAGLVDRAGGEVFSSVKAATPKDGNESILKVMGDLIESLLGQSQGKVAGIGVGIPGFVNREKGIALAAGNLNLRDMPISEYIRGRFGRSSHVENDTNAGALGEKWFGCGKGLRHFVYLAIGTGIGGGMILDGKLYLGKGNAGEMGHMVAKPDGELCVCRTPGCLEMLASGNSIARHAVAKLETGGSSSLRDDFLTGKPMTSEAVIGAARSGDRLAMEVIEEAGKYLALSLVSLTRLLDPEAIIIGGGVSQAKDLLSDVILSAVPTDWMRSQIKELLRFSPWSSGIVGAASVVLEKEAGRNCRNSV